MKTAAWLLATELGLRVFMRHEQIRQLVTAQPFRPITIFYRKDAVWRFFHHDFCVAVAL